MGRLFVVSLEGRIYSCKHCRTHLALYEDIVSKSFQSRHGKAYLFSKVRAYDHLDYSHGTNSLTLQHLVVKETHGKLRVNVTIGVKETRMMMTGMHTVADVFCVGCGSIVGWTYETAFEKSQKYKEGKSVLERLKVSGPGGTSYWASHTHSHEAAHGGVSDADEA